jgi:hypothetical protein
MAHRAGFDESFFKHIDDENGKTHHINLNRLIPHGWLDLFLKNPQTVNIVVVGNDEKRYNVKPVPDGLPFEYQLVPEAPPPVENSVRIPIIALIKYEKLFGNKSGSPLITNQMKKLEEFKAKMNKVFSYRLKILSYGFYTSKKKYHMFDPYFANDRMSYLISKEVGSIIPLYIRKN